MSAVVRTAQGCFGWRHTARRYTCSSPELGLDHSHWAGQARGEMWGGGVGRAWHAPGCWALLPPDSQLHLTATWAPLFYFIFIKILSSLEGYMMRSIWAVLTWNLLAEGRNANYLYLKIDWENMLFFCVVFFSPLLADCLVVLTDERKIKTPSVIRHSRLVFVWLAI